MTDTMFTRTALTEAAERAGVTADQARTILEAAGVTVQPEKPALPTDPGSVVIATEVRGERGEWRMMLDFDGHWHSPEQIYESLWHDPKHITAWDPARIVPVAAAPVTLTEDQVGEGWDKKSDPSVAWRVLTPRNRKRITTTVNTFLAQYAAPAEGELIADAAKPIDPDDVRAGDRVRLVLDSRDEGTITVTRVSEVWLDSRHTAYHKRDITAVYLLHREEA